MRHPRPVGRGSGFVAIIVAVAATVRLANLAASAGLSAAQYAFCGEHGQPQLLLRSPEVVSGVTMQIKARRWSNGIPDKAEIARRRVTFPSLNNMKDQYFILWIRSQRVKYWFPINIISGSEAAKNLKGFKENDVAKAVGADRLADYQLVRAIGMNIYGQADEVNKQALQMHPRLKYAKVLQYGYKEIPNNTEFNENPSKFLGLENISTIPPEAELRNVLDDAGDAVSRAGSTITKASDNIKGFLSGFGR